MRSRKKRSAGVIRPAVSHAEGIPRRPARLLLTGALVASFALASIGEAVEMRSLRRRDALTGPQTGSPLHIAQRFVAEHLVELNLRSTDIADVVVMSSSTSKLNGVTHLYMRQRYLGIEIVDANLHVHVAADGRVLSVSSSLIEDLAVKAPAATPTLSAADAIVSSAGVVGLRAASRPALLVEASGADRRQVFAGAELSQRDIPVKLAYQRDNAGELHLCWDISIDSLPDEHHWSLQIDAITGETVGKTDWTSYEQYQVYALPAASPNHVTPLPPGDGRTVLVSPADASASPSDWTPDRFSSGNNVDAYEDGDNNNAPTGGNAARADGGAGQDFSFPYDWSLDPTTSSNQQASITNLFYMNNRIHDILWHNGFDEEAGNFQIDNFGRGGFGDDAVFAEAQDSLFLNNATFSTPPDGQSPRMQMMLWTAPEQMVVVSSPVTASYDAVPAAFGPAPLAAPQPDVQFVLAEDGTANNLGCNTFTNAADVAGNVAIVDRGDCSFDTKVTNAQSAGAVAVVVINNIPEAQSVVMAGGCPGCAIPAVMVKASDGQLLRSMIPGALGRIEDPASPQRLIDSALDNGVIAHEYAHGLSNRLVGGPANVSCLSTCEQPGEGWSDLIALILTMEPGDVGTDARGIGNFVRDESASGPGIRSSPYTTDLAVNPKRYSMTQTICQAHDVGEHWAAITWEIVWPLIDKYGFDADLVSGGGGNRLALQYIVEGMKNAVCNPTFCDARDGILQAIPHCDGNLAPGQMRSDDCCLVWNAFAKRGLGLDASCGSSETNTDNVDGCVVPAECLVEAFPTLTPIQPLAGRNPRSACSAPSQRRFRIDCPVTNPDPHPVLRSTSSGSSTGLGCEEVIEEFAVACGDIVEIRLMPTPMCCRSGQIEPLCPAGPRPATSVSSSRVLIVEGERVTLVHDLRVCRREVDPTIEPSPLCDARLADGTCCPALAQPVLSCAQLPSCGCAQTESNCFDGIDNDCDSFIDCSDSDCAGDPGCGCVPEVGPYCGDGIDNDCDGFVDCTDSNCVGVPGCGCGPDEPPNQCGDGFDNDCDGFVDCDDSDCVGVPGCGCGPIESPNQCGDGFDNDCDGFVDCADSDCGGTPGCSCVPEVGPHCGDGIDNDCDGFVDCDDSDCVGVPGCGCGPIESPNQCLDGFDNDCDGFVDCADSDCAGTPGCSCVPEVGPYCGDGVDNDCDGLVDCADSDCTPFCN